MRYKIIKSFGGYVNFDVGQVREFTDAEAQRYAHLIEPIESDSVNSLDGKPHKQYKKGRKKG